MNNKQTQSGLLVTLVIGAITGSMPALAEVKSKTAEEFVQYGPEDAYWVFTATCADDQQRIIQRKTDGELWCIKDAEEFCDENRDKAADIACGPEFADSEAAEEQAREAARQAEAEAARAQAAERARQERQRQERERARAAEAERAAEQARQEAAAKDQISIEEQLLKIEQEKLELRRQELELQRRAVEIQALLDESEQ